MAAPAGAHRFRSGAWGRPEGDAYTARRAQPIRRVGELDASRAFGAPLRGLTGLRPRRKRARLQDPPGSVRARHHAPRPEHKATRRIGVTELNGSQIRV